MKKKKTYTPSKWSGFKEAFSSWWGDLSTEEKVLAKQKFVSQSIKNKTLKNPYPDMPDISHLRLSQLTDSHIYRIWVFKDRNENLLKP